MRTLIATAVLALLVGCTSQAESSAPTFVNATCPMMDGGEIDAEGETVEWNGHTVGFCCDGCGGKFEALSDEEKTAKLAAAGAEL